MKSATVVVCLCFSLLFRVVVRFYTTIALFITRQKVHKYEFSTNISVLLAIEPAAADTAAVILRSINDNRSNDKFNNTLAKFKCQWESRRQISIQKRTDKQIVRALDCPFAVISQRINRQATDFYLSNSKQIWFFYLWMLETKCKIEHSDFSLVYYFISFIFTHITMCHIQVTPIINFVFSIFFSQKFRFSIIKINCIFLQRSRHHSFLVSPIYKTRL